MALSQRLDLRQTQTLVMTPQLQQAIKLLQMSNIELADYVDREIERNPLLDHGSEGGEDSGEAAAAAEPAPERPAPAAEYTGTDTFASSEHFADAGNAPLDADYGNVWDDEGGGSPGSGAVNGSGAANGVDYGEAQLGWSHQGGSFEEDDRSFDASLSQRPPLRDHLMQQVNTELTDPADRMIGAHLIEYLDEAGYFVGDLAAPAAQLGCPEAQVARVLKVLQGFDPAGIFARTLGECLAAQLAERNRLDPAIQALLDNLDSLAARDYPGLMRLCGVDREDLAEMIAEIKRLNPRPGFAYDSDPVQPVTPDVLMRAGPDGGWALELNPETLPKVLINHRYYSNVSAGVRVKSEKDYIAECFATANWLVKSLHQRATTILKVASEVVRQQDRFFVEGVPGLKPLILRDIAEAIGMHESTVSRVTSNKYIATPRGVFELKYFFSATISGTAGGDAHSAEAVRYRIKKLIDEEKPDAVLSDDRIVEILRQDGIDIARRTVAKYREALHIPSSVRRRREKGAGF
ncbi:MAG: RNA polymerase factor sigma-54 [Alphaproteobacteria bacterium]|jgi:RNA polymerase sigma-54 factor|nr:RNA polymerase factor sigma-54 [Alphaproteobacteria bacterium]